VQVSESFPSFVVERFSVLSVLSSQTNVIQVRLHYSFVVILVNCVKHKQIVMTGGYDVIEEKSKNNTLYLNRIIEKSV